jgi:hypothetical protein
MSTGIATTAGKLAKKSQGLRERYREELERLEAPERYELAVEFAHLIQERSEQDMFMAQVQKEVIESWTDDDYAEMGVDRNKADTELGFTTTLLPLADLHSESEKRKTKARERLEATWGEDWEDSVGDLMPPWPAEEFLRCLAVFSEKNTDWSTAEVLLQDRIRERLAAKKTKKVPWLTARDVTRKSKGKEVTSGEGPAGRVSVAETEVAGQPSVDAPAGENLSPGNAAGQEQESTAEGVANSEAGTRKYQGSISYESSPVPPIAEDRSGAEVDLDDDSTVKEGAGKEVATRGAGEVEAQEPSRKRGRKSGGELNEGKRRKLGVAIPVINLDVDEGVEELKREAQGEEEKDDALAVEGAMQVLFGGERPDKERARRLLEKVMRVLRAEVVEVEDEE